MKTSDLSPKDALQEGFLPDAEFRELVLAVAKLMDGLCLDQIKHALHSVDKLCTQGATFSTQSLAFQLNIGLQNLPSDRQQ